MAEFALGGVTYRSRLMGAYDQWQLLNRLEPIMPALSSLNLGVGADIGQIAASLAPLTASSDEDVLYVFDACRAACEERKGETWGPVGTSPGMAGLMRMVAYVVAENFAPLLAMKRPSFRSAVIGGLKYEPVAMPDNEDWLFRPVIRGLCKAESLYDGTLRIERIAKLNDALDVNDENEARARKAAEKR